MTTATNDLDEMIKMSQIDINKLDDSDFMGKLEKIRTLIRFNEAKRQKGKMSQSSICKTIGTSVSTLERIRYDLGVSSPYRYEKSIKSDAQKEKEK